MKIATTLRISLFLSATEVEYHGRIYRSTWFIVSRQRQNATGNKMTNLGEETQCLSRGIKINDL